MNRVTMKKKNDEQGVIKEEGKLWTGCPEGRRKIKNRVTRMKKENYEQGVQKEGRKMMMQGV